MKKIGIITHYYQSLNYGGNLQAYALTAFLRQRGYDAEQISFSMQGAVEVQRSLWQRIKSKGFCGCFKAFLARLGLDEGKREEKKHQVLSRRREAFAPFNQTVIPHSADIYTAETVGRCADRYDVFITGSDQVFNPDQYIKAFFLDFVPPYKTKLSYAASLAKTSLSEEEKAIFSRHLADFSAVSLREESAASLLEPLLPQRPAVTLDPTLLLDRAHWASLAEQRCIEEDYLFCYFLGDNRNERRLAEAFAREKGLKTVTIAFASGSYCSADKGFGDRTLYDVSPEGFLSLIRHAAYIFTDSFHAVVFSYLFEKQFFVFHRSATGEMSARITDITTLLGVPERFSHEKREDELAHLLAMPAIDYSKTTREFEKRRQESIDFLLTNIGDQNETKS